MRHRLAASTVATLVLALAAFTGTSLAGNGHGNGGQSSDHANNPSSQPTTPAPAPAPAAAPAAAPKAHGNSSAAHAAAPKTHGSTSKKSSTSPSNPATGGTNSHGVKPSNTTKHDTYAKASSDQTKKYGNGKTAGQIATQAGYADATLHGPGNSQPHKVLCGGHEVDVHALKAKGAKCGTSTPSAAVAPAKHEEQKAETAQTQSACAATTQTVTEQVLTGVKHFIGPKGSGRYVVIHPSTKSAHYTGKHPDDVPIYETVTKTITVPASASCSSAATQTQTVTTTTAVTQAVAAAAIASAQAQKPASSLQVTTQTARATATAAGGVKGATVTLTPKKKASHGGVLGATTRLGSAVTGRNLPFTGLPLWIFVAVAAGLIFTGVAVRRASDDRI